MRKFIQWWEKESGFPREKRYITLLKSFVLALLPLVCVMVYCVSRGRSPGEVYLPVSEWNDELFYFKQVEGIVHYGYPQGYFGFNESHAMKLSFAAWSPVLVFPWILWGLLFGWNLLSPIACNIFLLSLCCFLFVWLVKPAWKQLGILTLLFCLYTPFVRYMLSGMPEVICFTMLILFYALAIHYQRGKKSGELVLLFLLSGVMTLMRPYMLLFLLLPVWLLIDRQRKKGKLWRGAAGAAAVLVFVLGLYACIKHYLGAEYFTPLFYMDWISSYFEQGLFGGMRYTASRLYRMGTEFLRHTRAGFENGLASGAFFACHLVCGGILAGWSYRDWRVLRRRKADAVMKADGAGKENKPETGASGTEKETAEGAGSGGSRIGAWVTTGERALFAVEVHMALSFIAMLFALLLMYKLTEGSKHLLTFIAAAVFVVPLMDTKFYKKAVLLGVTFAYFLSYRAVDPYDYQVPFIQEQRSRELETWRGVLDGEMMLNLVDTPNYDNVVIWVFADQEEGKYQNIPWQLLYAVPEGFGISCCMDGYVKENFDTLKSRYLASIPEGHIAALCREAGYQEVYRDETLVLYDRQAQESE